MENGYGNGFGRTVEPEANRWYDLKLGSSFTDTKTLPNSATKFCTLRYEFKPASIDKTQPGSLHKSKENRVTVEFHNIQPGKPKVSFEGSSEDHKELDGVLFFDGDTFQLEKLNRAFKSLKHMRVPGESNLNCTGTNGGGSGTESHSPPLGKVARTQAVNRPSMHSIPVEVERIDIGEPENINIGTSVTRPMSNKSYEPTNTNINPDPFSPSPSNRSQDEHLDILGDSNPGTPNKNTPPTVGIDINAPNLDFDDEIEIAFDDDMENGGLSAAEALMRAQGNVTGDFQSEPKEKEQETSSSAGGSSSSGSSSASGSGSVSSSSESDGADTASSAGDVDIC